MIQERVQAGLKRARAATLSRNVEALAAVDFLNDCHRATSRLYQFC